MLEKIFLVLVLLCTFNCVCWGQFRFPELQISALSPRGFRVQFPDEPGIELFGFHGKLNGALEVSREGDITGDVITATDGNWVFEDPDIQLKIGDKIYYWAYIQQNKAGYAAKDKVFEVTSFSGGGGCVQPVTVATGAEGDVCSGKIIFEDNFNEPGLNRTKWNVQNYLPFLEDDHYEFVSYQDTTENIFIRNSVLYLKPTRAGSITGTLDLGQGCTRRKKNSCSYTQVGGNILPPVVSAKILSRVAFRYGKIEIRAKVPIGDWIYPQIELIPKGIHPAYPKILLAYTRGNLNMMLKNDNDIGNTLLFGGPVTTPEEPGRSINLRSKRLLIPLGREMRTYTLQWKPSGMDFIVDSDKYGSISSTSYSGFNAEYQIALGVGVGGIYDFPDSVTSGNYPKPWINDKPRNMKAFYNQRNTWEQTWNGDDPALQIESVKVWAL